MPERQQTYANHTRYLPAFHYFASPVLILNVGWEINQLVRNPGLETAWGLVVAIALFVGVALGRTQALTAQNRVIRLEETLRMRRLLPAATHAEIALLQPRDFVALRFASDEELPDLFRRVRAGEFASSKAIKQAIRHWRPDHLRV